MTYQTSAKVLKTIAGLAVASTFLSACNNQGIPESAAVPEPVVPTLPAVEEPISFNNTTATAPSTIAATATTGFFDGNNFNGPLAGFTGTYNHLTSQATFGGKTVSVTKVPGYNYVAGYDPGSNQLGLVLFGTETLPTAGTANYTGAANYNLTQGGATSRLTAQPATIKANFLTNNAELDVTGTNTIALRNLEIDRSFKGFYKQGSTTASIAGAGITDVPALDALGTGQFAGPTAQEVAGFFTLNDNAGTEVEMDFVAKQ